MNDMNQPDTAYCFFYQTEFSNLTDKELSGL